MNSIAAFIVLMIVTFEELVIFAERSNRAYSPATERKMKGAMGASIWSLVIMP